MKILSFVFCFLIAFFCFCQPLNSMEFSIKILVFSTNPLYGHSKFDVLTGIRNKLKQINQKNIVIKSINFDSKTIDSSLIDREIIAFNPSLTIMFDKPEINRKRLSRIFEISLYNVQEITNNINILLKNSKIKPNKTIVFYDDFLNLDREKDFQIISDTLPNVEFVYIKSTIQLREELLKYQRGSPVIFITLLRYIYSIDSGEYITEPLICKEFVDYNKNHLDFAFRQHTNKYGISISIGQNNVKLGENIINEYYGFRKEEVPVLISINKNKLYKSGYSSLLYDNYHIISNIYEK